MDKVYFRNYHKDIQKMIQVAPLVIDQGVRSLLRLGITLAVARLCSKDDFSFYTTLQPIHMYMLFFCTSFIFGPYIIFIHDRHHKSKDRYNAAVALLFFLSLLVLAILYALLYRLLYPPAYHTLHFLLASLWFIAGDLFNIFSRHLCLATMDYLKPLLSGLSSAVLFGAGFFVMNNSITVSRLLLLAGSGYMIPSLVVWLCNDKRFSGMSCKDDVRRTFVRHYHFGKWVFLNNLLNTMVFASFPFFLRFFGRSEQISHYGAYYNFFAILNPIIFVVIMFCAPRLARSFQAQPGIFSRRIRSVLKYTMLLSAAFLCFLLLAGKHVFVLFYGHEYTVLTGILLIWGFAKAVEINSCVLNAAMKATQQTFRIFLSSVAGSIIFLLIGLPLVNYAGLWGVAVCLTITQIAWLAALGYFLFYRHLYVTQTHAAVDIPEDHDHHQIL